MEYPVPGAVPGYRVTAGRQELSVNASASDTILFSAGTKGSTTTQKFTVMSGSSTAANYGFAGTFFGFDVTGKTGIPMTNATLIACGKIDAKGSSINNVIVRNSVSTTAAARLENGGSASGASFTKGAETYAIEIAGNGTVTLENTTFSGYSKPLNILATSGTVTINLAIGETSPTFDTAGAAVTFVRPQTTFTIGNIVSGSRLLIRRTDTQAVLLNETVSGNSRVYSYTYSVNIPVEIVLRKATGSTAYQEWRTTATLTAVGGAVNASQQLDE